VAQWDLTSGYPVDVMHFDGSNYLFTDGHVKWQKVPGLMTTTPLTGISLNCLFPLLREGRYPTAYAAPAAAGAASRLPGACRLPLSDPSGTLEDVTSWAKMGNT